MAKKRLYQVAREYDISSEAMVKLVRELGFQVKSHMSTATDEMLKSISSRFTEAKATVKKEIDRRKKLHKESRHKQHEVKEKKEDQKETLKKPEEPPEKDTEKTVEFKADERGGIEKIATKAQQMERSAKQATEQRKKRRERRKKKKKRHEVQTSEVKAVFKKTMAKIDLGHRVKKYKRHDKHGAEIEEEESNIIQVTEFMPLAELAAVIGVKPADLISKCMELGMMVTINQRLDIDTIATLALEYELEIEEVKEIGVDEEEEEEENEDQLKPRAPIITIMGHVDHGKTSLLDHIRRSNVVAGEAGAITQHIGAYQVMTDSGEVTFLDTPGHEAFTAMRARGAQITDIVVLVVAADDGVMPQTLEAIDHARAASVPIIVAINKMDKPGARPDVIKQQLANHNLLSEEWGGKTIVVEISAKTGAGIDKLLEMILLQAEILELTGNPDQTAKGIIVEAKLDRGRGVITTVIVRKGTLYVADPVVAGNYHGKVRAMVNDRGDKVTEIKPGEPVQVIGMSGVPQAGDSFFVANSDAEAREISAKRLQIKREHEYRQLKRVNLTSIYDQIKEGKIKELKLVIKGDVDGSVQVLRDTLEKIGTSEVRVNVIHHGVGPVSESDVLLAAASEGIIIGFHVRPDSRAREMAAKEKIDIRLYTVIYEVEDDIRKALEGLLEPDREEKITGTAEVKTTFKVPKYGVIAGSLVQSGAVHKGDKARVIRNSISVYNGKIDSLRRFKDDTTEVGTGLECGIKVENFNDIKAGDLIETYEIIEIARKL